jgi:transcriptional regulator with XRE-family HTH domain
MTTTGTGELRMILVELEPRKTLATGPRRLATIVRVERNQVEPRGSTIRKLAEALGVEPEELVKTEG